MEIARDEVRVMTVHGAKGLEAPIVILADTMTPPAGPRPPRLLELAGGAVIWAGRKDDDVAPVAAARADGARRSRGRIPPAALRRHDARRRPADHLRRRRRTRAAEGCWYDLVAGPLQPFLVEEDEGGEKVLRYRKPMPGRVAGAAPPPRRSGAPTDTTYRRGSFSRLPSKRRAWCRCRPPRRSRRTSAALLHPRPPPPPNAVTRWRGAASCIG